MDRQLWAASNHRSSFSNFNYNAQRGRCDFLFRMRTPVSDNPKIFNGAESGNFSRFPVLWTRSLPRLFTYYEKMNGIRKHRNRDS